MCIIAFQIHLDVYTYSSHSKVFPHISICTHFIFYFVFSISATSLLIFVILFYNLQISLSFETSRSGIVQDINYVSIIKSFVHAIYPTVPSFGIIVRHIYTYKIFIIL